MKTIINYNLLSDCRVYVVKIEYQAFLPSLLTLVNLVLFCLDQCQMENVCSDDSPVHEL